MDVQMQAGGCDCGVFTTAFATSLCFGHQPGKFHFNQSAMRKPPDLLLWEGLHDNVPCWLEQAEQEESEGN